jgi:hypothetical protein
MAKMFKLPFGSLPGHWGLKGKTRAIAQAEYELEGYELECRLLEIEKDNYKARDYDVKLATINFKYSKINEFEYHRTLANAIEDVTQRELAILEVDRREGKVSDLEYEKKTATLKGEPWVTVINMDFSKGSALEGNFELDWNDQFVEKLKKEGYSGPTPDNIVNMWFMEVCRNVAMEEFDGQGDFTGDSAANLEAVKRWSTEVEITGNRKSYR